MPGHLHPFDHPAGVRTGADRTGRTGAIGLAVGALPAAEAVTLHHPGETASLGRPGDIHPISLLEDITPHLLSHLPLTDIVHAELSQIPELPQPLHVALLG